MINPGGEIIVGILGQYASGKSEAARTHYVKAFLISLPGWMKQALSPDRSSGSLLRPVLTYGRRGTGDGGIRYLLRYSLLLPLMAVIWIQSISTGWRRREPQSSGCPTSTTICRDSGRISSLPSKSCSARRVQGTSRRLCTGWVGSTPCDGHTPDPACTTGIPVGFFCAAGPLCSRPRDQGSAETSAGIVLPQPAPPVITCQFAWTL
jgi:hypothetical protein